MATGPEDFLLHYRRILTKACPYRWLYPRTFAQIRRHLRNTPTGHDIGTILARYFVVGKNLLTMLLTDHRTKVHILILPPPHAQGFRPFLETLDEFIKQWTLDVDPLCAKAHLATVSENGTHGALDRLVDVRIRKNNGGVLSTQFKGDRHEAFRGSLHDRCTRLRLAGERNAINVGVTGQKLTRGIRPKAMNNVVDTLRNARLVHDFSQQRCSVRRFFRRLHNDGITTGKCRADFPRHQQKREVPWGYHRNHATGFADSVIVSTQPVRCIHLEAFGRNILYEIRKNLEISCTPGNINMRRK